MQQTLLLGLWAIAAYISIKFLLYFVQKGRNAVKARQLGCQDPPFFNPWDVFGVIGVYGAISADKAKGVPQLVLQRWQYMSKKAGYPVRAMKVNVMGGTVIFTTEPKNIQAILATKFKDFALGPRRINNFGPLLGHGIVSFGYRPASACMSLQSISLRLMGRSGSFRVPCCVPSSRASRCRISTWRRCTCRI